MLVSRSRDKADLKWKLGPELCSSETGGTGFEASCLVSRLQVSQKGNCQ